MIDSTNYLRDERILIFQLGGSTLDLTILNFEPSPDQGGLAETLAIEGDSFLGGCTFDNEIFEFVLAAFCDTHNLDKSLIHDRSKKRLRIECEKAKILLSSALITTIEVDFFYNEIDLSVEITRTKFEQLCSKYFKRCMERVEGILMALCGIHAIYDSEGFLINKKTSSINAEKTKIEKCILVGGSSQIPMIQNLLKDFFGEYKIVMFEHPKGAAAIGAAFQAALVMSPDAFEI